MIENNDITQRSFWELSEQGGIIATHYGKKESTSFQDGMVPVFKKVNSNETDLTSFNEKINNFIHGNHQKINEPQMKTEFEKCLLKIPIKENKPFNLNSSNENKTS